MLHVALFYIFIRDSALWLVQSSGKRACCLQFRPNCTSSVNSLKIRNYMRAIVEKQSTTRTDSAAPPTTTPGWHTLPPALKIVGDLLDFASARHHVTEYQQKADYERGMLTTKQCYGQSCAVFAEWSGMISGNIPQTEDLTMYVEWLLRCYWPCCHKYVSILNMVFILTLLGRGQCNDIPYHRLALT